MAIPSTRVQFTDYYLSTMLPALEAVIADEQASRPEQYPNFFNVEDTTNSIVQKGEIATLGTFNQTAEGENVRYDAPIQAFNKTYTPVDWSLGTRITHRMVADDKYGLIKAVTASLPQSGRETIEVEAAAVYNRAFNSSYLGPDGVILCSTAHPMVGGGTQANRPTDADLDIPSLEAMVTLFRKFTNHRGIKKRLIPKYLVVPPELAFAATEILMSTLKSGTANNNVNAFRAGGLEEGMITPKVYEYLTDTDAWFLTAEPSSLRLRVIHRERFATMHDVDFDSRSIKTAAWQTFVTGFDGWEGVAGTQGA
jgi:hypothetical protein